MELALQRAYEKQLVGLYLSDFTAIRRRLILDLKLAPNNQEYTLNISFKSPWFQVYQEPSHILGHHRQNEILNPQLALS